MLDIEKGSTCMKRRLLTPGPTAVPEETLLELAKPVFHHRTAEMREILREVEENLQYIYCTKSPVVVLTSSGTGGMEAALVNTVSPGQKVICLIGGRWGERWRHICKAYGFEAISVEVEYGQAIPPAKLEQALKEHPDAVAVCSTLSETATGVGHDIESFGKLVKDTSALFLVDGISGLGVMECRTDDWHVDMCVTGSQKALMMPPGLGFVSVSEKAAKVINANEDRRVFYFDLKKALNKLESFDTPYTPANTMIRALGVSLKQLREEGIENVWARHAHLAEATRAGMQAMNLELFAERPATGLTVAKVPENVDGVALLQKLEKEYGIKLAGGQDTLKGKIIRLAHMGYADQFDVLAALSGLELVLLDAGHNLEAGAGVAAAQRVFAKLGK